MKEQHDEINTKPGLGRIWNRVPDQILPGQREEDGGPVSEQAVQTPIQELLRSVPIGVRIELSESDHGWRNIPVGVHCHGAADKIDYLESQIRVLRAKIAALEELDTLP